MTSDRCTHVSRTGNKCTRKAHPDYPYCTKCLRLTSISKQLGLSKEQVEELIKPRTVSASPAPSTPSSPGFTWTGEEDTEEVEEKYNQLIEDAQQGTAPEPEADPLPTPPQKPEAEDPEPDPYENLEESEETEGPKKKIFIPTRSLLVAGITALGDIAERQVAECCGIQDDITENEELMDLLEEIVEENLEVLGELSNTEKAVALLALLVLNRVSSNMMMPREKLEELIRERMEAKKPQSKRKPVF